MWIGVGEMNYRLYAKHNPSPAKHNPSPGERVPPVRKLGAGGECGRKWWMRYAETDLARLKVSSSLHMYHPRGYLPHSTSDPLFLAALGRATFSPGEGLSGAPAPVQPSQAKRSFKTAESPCRSTAPGSGLPALFLRERRLCPPGRRSACPPHRSCAARRR